VREEIRAQLLRLNLEFYQTLAVPFSETRSRLQPGVVRALASLPRAASVLDLGCGNGELARELARREHQGPYLGLDSSSELLAMACQESIAPWARFGLADLAAPDWAAGLGMSFEQAFAFALLHHLPGEETRLQFADQVWTALKPGGRFALSVWNFLQSERLRARVLPWHTAGVDESDLEPGDFLLDWRRGGSGLRYVHHFTEDELAGLAKATRFAVAETYRSDGKGGRLGLYQVWEKVGGGPALAESREA
jgi:tRNA (uracil-5-)-methyltransferase TRM9